MTYAHDVFLSYRRSGEWPEYVKRHFIPMFRHWLGAELGRRPRIFYDVERIETGMTWPVELAAGVGTSAVMVCLWSKEYFSSDWCAAELSHMLARRDSCPSPLTKRLVLAAVIHDGDAIPPELADIQTFPLQEHSSPWIGERSRTAEELSYLVRDLARDVAHALEEAPPYDPQWTDLAVEQFAGLFHRSVRSTTPPSLKGRAG